MHSPVETHCNASLHQNNAFLHQNNAFLCQNNASLSQNNEQYQNKFGPQSQNLSAMIRGFKGATTKQVHIAGFSDFAWQSRFHDHIIRNEKEFERISEYIAHNPENWKSDCYF